MLLSTIPIALVANTARIVVTGMLYQFASSDAAKKFSHDVAGWVMIPLAAALFGLELLYLCRLTQDVEQVDVTAIWNQNHSAVE
jgi:exosortase/archaeosortase family protein